MINFDPVGNGIFVGSCPTTVRDVGFLGNNLKVTAVLNLQSDADIEMHGIPWPQLEQAYHDYDVICLRHPIMDFDPDDLQVRLIGAVDTLNSLLSVGHRVYVHCNAGICRAPATVLGFLHKYRDMSLDDALEHLRERRPKVNPYMEAIAGAFASTGK